MQDAGAQRYPYHTSGGGAYTYIFVKLDTSIKNQHNDTMHILI